MPFRNLIAGIHPRLAVVLHDMLMVWIAWIAVSMLRWSLEPNPPPMAWFGPEVSADQAYRLRSLALAGRPATRGRGAG